MTAALVRRAEVTAPARRSPRRTPGAAERPSDRRVLAARPVGTNCSGAQQMRTREHVAAQAAVYRRRRGVAGVLVGAALAGLVWFFAIVGSDYEAATAPEPTSTAVVHVRAGESLSSVAARVAPQMPTQTVIAEIVELNHLGQAGLRVGQALVTPVY